VVLQMFFGSSNHLDSYKLVTTLFEAGDDVSYETTLFLLAFVIAVCSSKRGEEKGLSDSVTGCVGGRTWTPSGLTAMKLGGSQSIEHL